MHSNRGEGIQLSSRLIFMGVYNKRKVNSRITCAGDGFTTEKTVIPQLGLRIIV